MRSIVINKKRLGVTLVLIGLIMVMFGAEMKVDKRIKMMALMNNQSSALTKYDILDNKYSYKLPSDWTSNESNYVGNEMLYHRDFSSADKSLNGFVEVWNGSMALSTFVQRSKEYGISNYIYDNYEKATTSINDNEAYVVTYTMASNNYAYNAYEYFMELDNKVLKFSFFIKKSQVKENTPVIFKTLVETFQHNQ